MPDDSRPCTVADVLTHPALQLRPLSVAVAARTRIIASAQIVVEVEDMEGLGQHELVLILGSMPRSPEDLEKFVQKAVEIDAAAVAMPESYRPESRSRLIQNLAEREIPVLEVPQTTRFSDLIDTVNRFQSSPDAVRFNKMLTMQQSLVAALGPHETVSALLGRLAKLCGASAGMTSALGDVEVSEGVLPFKLLRDEIAGSSFPELELNVSGWNALAIRLEESLAKPVRWLIVGSRREQFLNSFVRAAARVTASLIDAADRIDVLVDNQDRAVRSSILSQLLELEPHDNPETLAERASALGISFAREVRVLELVRFGPKAKGTAAAVPLAERVVKAFGQNADALLISRLATGTVVLVEADPKVRETALGKLLTDDKGLLIGMGRAIGHVRDVRTSHHDAVLALQQARRLRGSRLFTYDEFEFTTRLLAHVGIERMAEWSAGIIGPIKSKPILLEALQAFFEAELDVMTAARTLHIHHNSLRYRILKIEEIVGGSLRSPETIAAVQLALMAEGARGASSTVRPRALETVGGTVARNAAAIDSPLETPGRAPSPSGLGAVLPE
ncbi:helix-turn-helix domain-containing protein [Arthrobacter sp. NPDC058130]|uniref:helix-turn-helix domain-containing protein n=1 Tax=Arthrobacter sp. NPDC058130 TaxID=3346353 RepID=UPI0036E64FD9